MVFAGSPGGACLELFMECTHVVVRPEERRVYFVLSRHQLYDGALLSLAFHDPVRHQSIDTTRVIVVI